MTLRPSQGFTLIELLVVIAIIGILSSVVLASLNTARTRAKDAAATSTLSQLRAQVELDVNGGSYATACTGTDSARLITSAGSQNGQTVSCYSTATAWAASIPLIRGGSFCVDASGFAGAGAAQTSGSCL